MPDVYEIYFNAAPADVALVSPQTPLIPPNHPHLSGGYSKAISLDSFYSRDCSGFFASSLAIIHLNKLSTLSLRLFPPLKPFERRDHFTDIYEDLAYMALGMYRSPCRPERSAGRTGELNDYSLGLRWSCITYRDISFDVHRSPCRQERSASRVGGAGRAFARTEGVFHTHKIQSHVCIV